MGDWAERVGKTGAYNVSYKHITIAVAVVVGLILGFIGAL